MIFTNTKENANEAFSDIKKELDPNNKGLVSRYPQINSAILKSWKPGNIYSIFGASGSGKSYILNNFRNDLTDYEPICISIDGLSSGIIEHLTTKGEFTLENNFLIRKALNEEASKKVFWISFGYDMRPKVDILRSIAGMMGISYARLLSSEGVKVNDNYIYNKLSEEELKVAARIMKEYVKIKNDYIYWIREPLNIRKMEVVIDKLYNQHHNLIPAMSIDHVLLINKQGNENDQEMMDTSAKWAKDIRDKYNAIIFPLGQMNQEIEEDKRRLNNNLHYPIKSDMYRGGQWFQSSDYVFMMFMPSSINIMYYGPREINTKKLIHFSMIKSRHGGDGHAWLYDNLECAQILNSEFSKKPKDPILPKKILF